MKKEAEKKIQSWKIQLEKLAVSVLLVAWCVLLTGMNVYASATKPDLSGVTGPLNVLYSIVAAIISSIGLIITLWGISEFGIAFQSNDGTSQAHSFKRIAGGLIMVLAPQILPLLVTVG